LLYFTRNGQVKVFQPPPRILLEARTLEVLLLSSRCCWLVTHSSNAPAIWDADAKTLLQPILVKDTMFQQPCDAMYLDDGEAYILLKSGRTDPDVYRTLVAGFRYVLRICLHPNEVNPCKSKSKQSLIGVADWVYGILFGMM
jgi:hypothetical protein